MNEKYKPQTKFGISFDDPYAWATDKSNPEVIQLLEDENAKTKSYTDTIEPLKETLYQEMISRVREDDESYPYAFGPYLYFSRIQKGQSYHQYLRKKDNQEELLLDVNELSEGKDFIHIREKAISPSHQLLAYSLDTNGSEVYELCIKDLTQGTTQVLSIENASGDLLWGADDATLFYTTLDETHRPYRVYMHTLGSNEPDVLLFEERDLSFYVSIDKTRSKRFVLIHAQSKITSEVHTIDLGAKDIQPVCFAPRTNDVLYEVDHHKDRFLILHNQNAIDFELCSCPLDQTSRQHWSPVIAHQEGRFLEDVDVFDDFCVLWVRAQGNQRLYIFDPKTQNLQEVPFEQQAYALYGEPNMDRSQTTYRFGYSSFKDPYTILELDPSSAQTKTLHQKKVPGNFDPNAYRVQKIFASSRDGKTKIPMSLLMHKDLQPSKDTRVVMYGYGSYGITVDPGFQIPALSVADRDMIYAIAHIRGSSTNGRSWYENGKFLNKKNTFEDFVDCATYLVDQEMTQAGNIGIMGGSAGGLLMGAVVNMEPKLWGGVVAIVPFVDVINTMLDESLPLTITEYDEWGNPNEEVYFKYMHGYAPYENLKDQSYPPILATGGINDPRVGFWEPLKWVLRLRTHQQAKHPIYLKMEMGAGHQGPSGRYHYYEERALFLAFLIDQMK